LYCRSTRQVLSKQGFHWQSAPRAEAVAEVTPALLQLRTATAGDYKIGADSPVATIVAVRDGIALSSACTQPAGNIPMAPYKAGFPVEIYSSGPQKKDEAFCELELLGPAEFTRAGQSWRHAVRWDLRRLPIATAIPKRSATRSKYFLLMRNQLRPEPQMR
jgi:hypothetical protein